MSEEKNEVGGIDSSAGHVPYADYKRPEFVYDNLLGDGRTQVETEATVHISSADRNVSRYPDPFQYRVTFNPVSTDETGYVGRSFSNVTQVKLEAAALPRRHRLDKTPAGSIDPALLYLLANGPLPQPNEVIQFSTGASFVCNASHVQYDKAPVVMTLPPSLEEAVVRADSHAIPAMAEYEGFTVVSSEVTKELITVHVADVSENNYLVEAVPGGSESRLATYAMVLKTLHVNYCSSVSPTTVYEAVRHVATDVYEHFAYSPTNNGLDDERTLGLVIEELPHANAYTSNASTVAPFATLYPDLTQGIYTYYVTHGTGKRFRTSALGNVNTFTMRFVDGNGRAISSATGYYDWQANNRRTCACTAPGSTDYGCSCTYVRHPLYAKFQHSLLFKIAFIELDTDKNVFD